MLDTNICIFTIKKKPVHVREHVIKQHDLMCVSTVTLAELFYGVEKSANPTRNLAGVEGFAARLEVVDFDAHAAAQTGQIRADPTRSGTPIGACDQISPAIPAHAA